MQISYQRGYSSVAEQSTADRQVTSSTLVAPYCVKHLFFHENNLLDSTPKVGYAREHIFQNQFINSIKKYFCKPLSKYLIWQSNSSNIQCKYHMPNNYHSLKKLHFRNYTFHIPNLSSTISYIHLISFNCDIPTSIRIQKLH